MRVTQKMIFNSMVSRMQKNQETLYEIAEHETTGKRVNKPSDDPVAAARINKLNGQLSKVEQYMENIGEGTTVLSAMETAVTDIEDQLIRAQEIIMEQLSGTQDEESQQAAAEELEQIMQQVLQQANAKNEGKFLFSGFASSTAPFDDSGNYLGGSGDEFEIEIGEGEYLTINICGDELMTTSSGTNIIQLLADLREHTASGDTDWLSDNLPTLQGAFDHITSKLSTIGSLENRLESAQSAQDTLSYDITTLISNLEDADITEVTAQYAAQENVLEATMAIAANYLGLSFLDFLE